MRRVPGRGRDINDACVATTFKTVEESVVKTSGEYRRRIRRRREARLLRRLPRETPEVCGRAPILVLKSDHVTELVCGQIACTFTEPVERPTILVCRRVRCSRNNNLDPMMLAALHGLGAEADIHTLARG